MPGMLDQLFDPSTYSPNGGGMPPWMATAQLPAGMLSPNGATPAPEPAGDVLPADSTPTSGKADVPDSSLLGRLASGLMGGLSRNSNMLMSMGAGFAGAPSFGQGMSRAFAAGPQGHQEDVRSQAYMGGISATYQALVSAGAKPHEALAAVYNPDILKQVTKQYFPGIDVSWQGGIPFNATTGARANIGNPALDKVVDPDTGQEFSTQVGANGQRMLVKPSALPQQPTPQAIDVLRKNPSFAGEFDRKYGPGASRQYVGQQQPQAAAPQGPAWPQVPGAQ